MAAEATDEQLRAQMARFYPNAQEGGTYDRDEYEPVKATPALLCESLNMKQEYVTHFRVKDGTIWIRATTKAQAEREREKERKKHPRLHVNMKKLRKDSELIKQAAALRRAAEADKETDYVDHARNAYQTISRKLVDEISKAIVKGRRAASVTADVRRSWGANIACEVCPLIDAWLKEDFPDAACTVENANLCIVWVDRGADSE